MFGLEGRVFFFCLVNGVCCLEGCVYMVRAEGCVSRRGGPCVLPGGWRVRPGRLCVYRVRWMAICFGLDGGVHGLESLGLAWKAVFGLEGRVFGLEGRLFRLVGGAFGREHLVVRVRVEV